jgi:hypothetical protein
LPKLAIAAQSGILIAEAAMITVLHEQSESSCPTGRAQGDDLWINAQELEAATGWSMKQQGLCRGDICIPVPPSSAAEHVIGDAVNIAAFWRRMGNPIVHDAAGDAWVLGTSAVERGMSLRSLEAPDFAFADLAGVSQTLAEQRGKKVLLVTWASW